MNKNKCFKLVVFLLSAYLISLSPILYSQSCYNASVDSIVSKVSISYITKYNRELSGDTSAVIGGQPYRIISRYWEHEGNIKASQYIFEKFQSFGLSPQYQQYRATGQNVIAKKTGSKYPNQSIIICGHYDSYRYNILTSSDTVPGSDDNASGTTAVLEAARVLSQYNFNYSLIFAAWDEEEIGLFGSHAYADTAFAHGDSIVFVINLDMIGWDSNNDNVFEVSTNNASLFFGRLLESSSMVYTPLLNPYLLISENSAGSDHYSFWQKGYKAVLAIEDEHDFNYNYHTIGDKIIYLNKPYYLQIIKAAIACLAAYDKDYWIDIAHVPLVTSADTSSRIAAAVIHSRKPLKLTGFGPRLYYKINNGNFSFLNAYYTNQDTFKFLLPGISAGNNMTYYFAAQDSAGQIVGTSPAGGSGINPPGTTPPLKFFTYHVTAPLNVCSSLPVNIPPNTIVLDTINVQSTKNLFDVNINLTINHSNDENLYIWICKEGFPALQLSQHNGGSGDNYTNTTFDDEAAIPITQGTPPFTGSFKPQSPLDIFDNKPAGGKWVLRVFNNSPTITGQLVNWCVIGECYDPIGIANNQTALKYSLWQNYPNPFNPVCKINYSVLNNAHIRIIVYDILGREVQTLINDKMIPGEYKAAFDGSGYSSGLYFYSMYIDGVLFETKKMILMK